MPDRLVDWCSSQWFSFMHGNHLVYNACWEDPRVDHAALGLTSEDTLLTITSAGCNALDYALARPQRIYAVDINPRQNALLELKIAGIHALDFELFFEIFGKGRLREFPQVYQRWLRPQLSEPAAAHWDRHLHYFTGEGRSGFYYRGTSGALARWYNGHIDRTGIRSAMHAAFEAETVSEQSDIYMKFLRKRLWTGLIRWLFQWDLPLAFAGVPRVQRRELEENYQGGMGQYMEDCLEAVFTRLPLKDNYFWWLYFNGSYSRHRCPEYLKRDNFLKLKSGLVSSIRVHTGSLIEFLRQVPRAISRFVLLDHMDWLTGRLRPVLEEEWQLLLGAAAPGARFLWRSAARQPTFVNPIEVYFQGSRARVGELLCYHTGLADELHAVDRVHTYRSFAVADLIDSENA